MPQAKITAIDKGLTLGLIGKIILRFPEKFWEEGKQNFYLFWDKRDKEAMGDDWGRQLVQVSFPMGASNVMTVWTKGDVAKLVSIAIRDVNGGSNCLRRYEFAFCDSNVWGSSFYGRETIGFAYER